MAVSREVTAVFYFRVFFSADLREPEPFKT